MMKSDIFSTAFLDVGRGIAWIVIVLFCAFVLWVFLLGASYAIMWVQGEVSATFQFWDAFSIGSILVVAGSIIGCWFVGSTIRQCEQIDKERKERRNLDNVRTVRLRER